MRRRQLQRVSFSSASSVGSRFHSYCPSFWRISRRRHRWQLVALAACLYVAIYRMQALHDACADKIARFPDTLPHLKTFLFSPANLPKSNESLISLHAGDAIDAEAQRYYAKEVSEWGALFLISYDEAGELTVTLSDSQTVDIEDIATANRIFRLVSNPQYSNRARDHQFVDWLSQYLVQCKQADLGDSTTVRMLSTADFRVHYSIVPTP